MSWRRWVSLVLFAACPLFVCCRGPNRATLDTSLSRDAKLETFETLKKDLETARHASDGGGKAWLAGGPRTMTAGSPERFEIVYEAGPLGIDVGGAVYLQTSSFWGWDSPQATHPEAAGYTEIRADGEGIELTPRELGPQLLAIDVSRRRLEPGERIHIVFGAGPGKARVDRYAEHRSPLWIAVDGDGDGVRALIEGSPAVDVVAGRPARLVLTLPSTARPGETVRLVLALLDARGNAGVPFQGEVLFRTHPGGLDVPESIRLRAEDRGYRSIDVRVRQEGVYRLEATVTARLKEQEVFFAESNPLVVLEGIPRVVWADLHGHSQISDGTGTPDDYFTYARDVAGLDVAALTDHDHWGMQFLDQNPALWTAIQEAAHRFNTPGRFVALAGYEWTSWLQGHRHVVYFDEEGDVLSAMDPRYQTPIELWKALEGRAAITVAHHSAGGPVSTNWSFRPPAAIEPVTEIVSVHGSSESADSPKPIYDPVDGNFVRDALERVGPLGFIGSGDSHDGHPGLAYLDSRCGGLAALFSEELTREGVLEALRSRSVYATNGPRIWLRMWLDGQPMGSVLTEVHQDTQRLRYAVASTAPIERIDLIRSGRAVGSLSADRQREASGAYTIPALEPGEYVYIRVLQEDGGMAWSSPIYRAAGS